MTRSYKNKFIKFVTLRWNLCYDVVNWQLELPKTLTLFSKTQFRKTPVKGILKSRPVTPEVIVDNVNIVERSKEVADKALNLLNPYRQIFNYVMVVGILLSVCSFSYCSYVPSFQEIRPTSEKLEKSFLLVGR